MKILFLPFLQMPTGHHTVADALIRSLERRISGVQCRKVDFFSYADKLLEKAFRLTYLTWIDHAPNTFVWLYRNFVYPTKSTKHFNWYEIKFLDKMKSLIAEEQPDLIVCTQAFPSFLINRLRCSGFSTPPVINVYTDFFINKLWGIEEIDYHFVPDQTIKYQLLAKYNLSPSQVTITGIPIDECFYPRKTYHPLPPHHILIAGGSGGLGDMENLILNLPQDKNYYFSLLCGNNHKLYKEVFALKQNNLKPLAYISSRDTMNALYSEAHAIITKPGGVTLSEALGKRLPIFVHSALPGQEQVNMSYLTEKKLIFPLDVSSPIAAQLAAFFANREMQLLWQQRVNTYQSQIECPAWQKMMEYLLQHSLLPRNYQQTAATTGSTS
jgi:processive 1,2-diacylglycerol beta-glucosyltransferase